MGEIHGTLHEIMNFWWKLLETSIFHPKFLGKSEVFLGISQLWSIPGRFGAGLPGAQGGFASGFASACTGASSGAEGGAGTACGGESQGARLAVEVYGDYMLL
jgi:hypothetical protein